MDLDVSWGEVHALLGENGAGKSTLMNVVYGLVRPDSGEIMVDGNRVEIDSPLHAIRLGIGMVHQHFMLIPPLTVAENIILGQEGEFARGLIDLERAGAAVRKLSSDYGLAVDPRAKVEGLSVGVQQRVEILKALYKGARILILDEPTAVLTPQEAKELFEVVQSLTAQGKSIIFISHKLNEVLEIADRITVLRRGKRVDTIPAEGATEQGLASLMVGREVLLRVDKSPPHPEAPLLVVDDLEVHDDRGLPAVRGVSFDVRAGEIVALAGVDGNGQSELIEALTGLRKPTGGKIVVAGEDITGDTPREALDAGLGHIPEDRQRRGLILEFSLAENIALHDYD
ncbi:MAG: ATP-binding cassette domain-containing protein, partial [Candidatus Dormibacteraeota bacterium]|nr:ATP-binding cassette domain-containing protein [Candidatus Dormibacteraeota bacterium]